MRGAVACGLALACVASLSCASAVRHPAITAGLVGAVVGFGTCEVEEGSHPTCAAIGGGAGLFLGGIAALVLWLSPPDDEPVTEGEVVDGPPLRTFTHDAGVLPDARAIDAGVDASIDAAPDAP